MFASRAVLIAISEFEILVFLGRNLEVIDREALVRARDHRVLFRLLARRCCDTFTLSRVRQMRDRRFQCELT